MITELTGEKLQQACTKALRDAAKRREVSGRRTFYAHDPLDAAMRFMETAKGRAWIQANPDADSYGDPEYHVTFYTLEGSRGKCSGSGPLQRGRYGLQVARRFGSHRPVQVDVEPCRLHLPSQPELPRFRGIERHVDHAVEVRRNLNTLLMEDAHSAAPQFPDEVAKLQDDVLTRAWLEGLRIVVAQPAQVFRREKNDGEPDVLGAVLDLLDERAPAARLFLEDDRVEPKPADEAGHGFSRSTLSSVDDEDAVADRCQIGRASCRERV